MAQIGTPIPLDPAKQSQDIGLVSTRGGVVVIGEPFSVEGNVDENGNKITEMCATFFTGTGGDILFESQDGTINPYLNTGPSQVLVVKAVRVVEEAVLNGDTFTTEAESMTWHGGQ